MKFSCEKSIILNAVTVTSKASASKASITALEGLLLELKDNALTITGYDMELGISTTIAVSDGENGATVINAKMLSDIIRKMPAGVIDFNIEEGKKATVSLGETQMSLMCLPADEYPELPKLSDENGFTLPQKVLKSMISQTKYACSLSDTKPAQKGCLFHGENDVFNVVACDGIRLALRTEPFKVGEENRFILSMKTLDELIHLLSDEDDKNITICINRNQILFKIDEYTMISRVINDEFMEYKKFLVSDEKIFAEIKCREIMETLDRVMLYINEKYKTPARFEFSGDTLKISLTTMEGAVSDKIPIKYNGEPITIGFNAKFMYEAFKATECDTVKMLLTTSPASPVILVPMEGREFTFLLVPTRLK